MSELCSNCGQPLPNAAGEGIYCNHCGEPVYRPKPKPPMPIGPRPAISQDT